MTNDVPNGQIFLSPLTQVMDSFSTSHFYFEIADYTEVRHNMMASLEYYNGIT